MSDKTAKETPRRTLTSLQSTGRIGRSTLKQGLMSWFSYAGIEFNAIDADPEHHTLSSWYPDLTDKNPYHDENDLLTILNAVGAAPVQLIDFPSQETQSILRGLEYFNAFELFGAKNTRPTVFIFASDERAAMVSAHQIFTRRLCDSRKPRTLHIWGVLSLQASGTPSEVQRANHPDSTNNSDNDRWTQKGSVNGSVNKS